MTSSKPAVVTRAPRGSLRSSTELVAIVVPCNRNPTSSSRKSKRPAASTMPVISPIEGSSGVVGVLRLWSAPLLSSRICRSVKVPPISMPMRIREPGATRGAGALESGNRRQVHLHDRHVEGVGHLAVFLVAIDDADELAAEMDLDRAVAGGFRPEDDALGAEFVAQVLLQPRHFRLIHVYASACLLTMRHFDNM